MNVKQISDKSEKSWRKYQKRKESIRKEIAALEAKIERLRWTGFREFFKPMAEEVKKRLKAEGYVWYGPFGLCSEQTIYWLKDIKKCIPVKGNVLGSVTFIDGGTAIRNRKKVSERFSKGTIGEMNGMNYETIKVTEKMDVEWIINWSRKR